MTTVYPSSDGCIQQENTLCHKVLNISNWFLQHENEITVLKLTKISAECFQDLVKSMPQIIKAVLKAKGGPNQY